MFLQVSAYYLTHRDVGAGVVTLVKKLKIKRIVIGSRFELDILIHNSILTCTARCKVCTLIKVNKCYYSSIKKIN
jgi:hypothetical protein